MWAVKLQVVKHDVMFTMNNKKLIQCHRLVHGSSPFLCLCLRLTASTFHLISFIITLCDSQSNCLIRID